MTRILIICSFCKGKIYRNPSSINSKHNFCNHHCSASFTNRKRTTKLSVLRKTRVILSPLCKQFGCSNHIGLENKIFCSYQCKKAFYQSGHSQFKEESIKRVSSFMKEYGRLPVKREFSQGYKRILHVFGSWNNLIKSAGFEPNPVLFSRKYIANDGHGCDSLSEKIIDDWMFARKIPHLIKEKYPWNNGMTADFKVGEYWIELFGLVGQLKSYDCLMKIKLQKVKEHNLNLISLFLSDLFPHNHLQDKLDILRKRSTYL
ncbi:MAG: hypothetical protein WA052_02030 [Microgenomates group bacterium]